MRAATDAMKGEAILVFTTVGDEDAASRLAARLVEERVAACVQIVSKVRSVYRWQGAVRHDDEVQLAIKTVAANLEALARLFRMHHPYELPELVAVRIDEGSPAYLDWVEAESTMQPS